MRIKAGPRVDEIWRGLSRVLRNCRLSFPCLAGHGNMGCRNTEKRVATHQTHIWDTTETPESHPKPPFLRCLYC